MVLAERATSPLRWSEVLPSMESFSSAFPLSSAMLSGVTSPAAEMQYGDPEAVLDESYPSGEMSARKATLRYR